MGKKIKKHWWVDLILFAGFITTFFLDFTGLSLHQLIGIFSIAIAAYHLFIHRDWIKRVKNRFFDNISTKSRIYFIVDYTLLLGFGLIGLTGLFISSWFNLPLANYTNWRDVHVAFSIATLALLVLKLGLHLRWIVSVSRKIFSKPAFKPVHARASQLANSRFKQVGRREFIATMSIIGAASLLAITKASKSLADSLTTTVASTSEELTQAAKETEATATQTAETTVASTQDATIKAETATLEPSATIESTTAPNAEFRVTEVPSVTDCTVRCNRGCSYPGRCRRYKDDNNNGLCDLGECL